MTTTMRPAYEVAGSGTGVSKSADAALVQQYADTGLLVFDTGLDADTVDAAREFTRARLLDGDGRPTARRMHNAWEQESSIRAIALAPRVLALLELLYGRGAVPFQTLNFARGSEQRTHADAIHFSTVPSAFSCGVWVALEDIAADAGPLHYYPGSHRLPEYQMLDCMDVGHTAEGFPDLDDYARYYEDFIAAVLETAGLSRAELTLTKGQAMIWAAGLCHGGSPIRDPSLTRFSQVTHYFFEDCLYYTPRRSHPQLGRWWLRNVRSISSGEIVPHSMAGRRFHIDRAGPYRFDRRLRPVSMESVTLIERARRLRRRLRSG